MTSSHAEEHLSDEEVFFGKITLKEIKKHILWNKHRQNTNDASSDDNYSNDIQIIETHSAPDLNNRVSPLFRRNAISNTSLSPDVPEAYSSWNIKPTDDSFLTVEKMVADMCVSPKKEKKNDEPLNNTLDIIDYILNNGPTNAPKSDTTTKSSENNPSNDDVDPPQIVKDLVETAILPNNNDTVKSEEKYDQKIDDQCTPQKKDNMFMKMTDKRTPCMDMKSKTPIFKTPGKPVSHRKPLVTPQKKTPGKNNAYQHIASPVASYIKNCPVAPLVKEVRPTKPLTGTSSIPKFVKQNSAVMKPGNKENLNLPSVAYKSAKKTQVIDVPDEDKLPQSQWIKKITSSLPKPLIMKHDHRETNLAKRILGSRQEDSFADLSLRQADVSICTQKYAYSKPKKL